MNEHLFPINPVVTQTRILKGLLSGESTFTTLKDSVERLTEIAPKNTDVVIEAFNIIVHKVVFHEPHTLLFRGVNDEGHDTFVVAHYSQVIAKIIYRTMKTDNRVITGFAVVR